MLQGIWDSWASGANQDAANEALRTGNPVNMGLLENFYGNKEDAENIEFKVNFQKSDLSGKVTVSGLNIVARCIA